MGDLSGIMEAVLPQILAQRSALIHAQQVVANHAVSPWMIPLLLLEVGVDFRTLLIRFNNYFLDSFHIQSTLTLTLTLTP